MAATERRCVIVSASPDCDPHYIEKCVNEDDYLICADGGVDVLKKTSLTPDLIVGDFDSANDPNAYEGVETVRLEVRKIDTDTMHCAQLALERGFREFLFLGATGGRMDHALANLSVLLWLEARGAHGVISDSYNEISLLHTGENVFKISPGTTVSVIPFGSSGAKLSYTGMSYPLENGEVFAEYPYTISNFAVSDTVTITLHHGSALVFFIH